MMESNHQKPESKAKCWLCGGPLEEGLPSLLCQGCIAVEIEAQKAEAK